MEPTIVKRYNSAPRAQIAASYLRDNGIECEVDGESLNYAIPLTGQQITLTVKAEDAARATELLAETEYNDEN